MNIEVNPNIFIGANNPPVSILDALNEKYKKDLDQAAELRDAAKSVPERIEDDATEAKVTETILKMRGLKRAFEEAQKAERKPYNDQVKSINGFFVTKIESLEKERAIISARSGDYLDRKAALERRKLEEEVEKKREEARIALEAAQKAERERLAAENARKEQERLAAVAQAEKEQAERDKKAAEERAAIAIETEKRLARERKERESKDVADAEARAAQKVIDDAAMTAARAEREEAEKQRAEAIAQRDAARVQQRQAEDSADEAKREEKIATRDTKGALEDALRNEKRADRIEQKAEGPDADLARTRSEHGGVATVSRNWTCRIVDASKLDYKTLQPFVPLDIWEICLRKWMLLQPATQEARQMPGAVMEIEVTAQHR